MFRIERLVDNVEADWSVGRRVNFRQLKQVGAVSSSTAAAAGRVTVNPQLMPLTSITA